MRFKEGIYLHFIANQKFKTNLIKVRFSAPLRREDLAKRALLASLLETANGLFPNSQTFREKLANLYGSSFNSQVLRRGRLSFLDIDISYVKDSYLSQKYLLTGQIMDFLQASLFHPLLNEEETAFDWAFFEIEKKNLLQEMDSDQENPYYIAYDELNSLFYQDEHLQTSRLGYREDLENLTAEDLYAYFQSMLREDQIDIYFTGQINEHVIMEKLQNFDLQDRQVNLNLLYSQKASNITREGFARKDFHQSVLEMGFHHPVYYSQDLYPALLVLNGLFAGLPHSKLFKNLREKEGLAYTVSSQVDVFTGLLRVYAGIDRNNKNKAVSLILKSLKEIRSGRFSDIDFEASKLSVKNNYLLSLDRQESQIERAFLNQFIKDTYKDPDKFLQQLEKIKKEDILLLAASLHLQAVYFLEGVKDETE